MMKQVWLAVAVVGGMMWAVACVGTLPPQVPTPPPPAGPVRSVFDTVVCQAAVDDVCRPLAGVTVKVHTATHPDQYDIQTTNADGYALWSVPASLIATDITFQQDGYLPRVDGALVADLVGHHNFFQLYPVVSPLPPAPTRDQMLNVHLTFQGLTVTTQQFGQLPWFEPALPWLSAADRQAVYAAKHASMAWGAGGDTHALVFVPSGPALYDEPGQPYAADRFPPLDWTAGNTQMDQQFAALVHEVIVNGFPQVLVFLGGDDGAAGFPVAMAQAKLVSSALRQSVYGDLTPYVVVLPGFDGVFYGYSPDQVAQWGASCRLLFTYCGVEHQPGRIPVGEGGSDYLPGGRMTTFDLILAEFNGPNDSAWRTQRTFDAQGRPDYPGNQIWQIGARMLGPAYHRPSDQPADSDSASPPFYLAPLSPRGPFVHCAFEWVGEYLWVRGRESADDIVRDRNYFKSAGYTCGG
jgi:hypothetical protein